MEWVRATHISFSQTTNGYISLSEARVRELFAASRAHETSVATPEQQAVGVVTEYQRGFDDGFRRAAAGTAEDLRDTLEWFYAKWEDGDFHLSNEEERRILALIPMFPSPKRPAPETPAESVIDKLCERIKEMRRALYTYGTYGEAIGGPVLDGVLDVIDELSPPVKSTTEPQS
mgnify:CR=1 FL=1